MSEMLRTRLQEKKRLKSRYLCRDHLRGRCPHTGASCPDIHLNCPVNSEALHKQAASLELDAHVDREVVAAATR